jgi:hypothetical protein
VEVVKDQSAVSAYVAKCVGRGGQVNVGGPATAWRRNPGNVLQG